VPAILSTKAAIWSTTNEAEGYSFGLAGSVHCKKNLAVFPYPAGLLLTKLSLAKNNIIIPGQEEFGWVRLHCKKELAVFPSPAGMSLIKLFLGGNNLVFSRPERVWSVTSRLGTGKWLTLFYSVGTGKPANLFLQCGLA
jgi:hypothetical protein